MLAKFHQKHAYATHKGNLSPKDLNVAEVVEQFEKEENSPAHHNGTFKIKATFEKALDVIVKAPHQPKPKSVRKDG